MRQQCAIGPTLLNEELLDTFVGGVIEQHGVGGLSIATGAADLLKIRLKIPWHVEVNHIADIRLVNTHTKGFGADDDIDQAFHEQLANIRPLADRHLAVIGARGIPSDLEQPRQVFGLLGCRNVNQHRRAARIGHLHQQHEPLNLIGLAANSVIARMAIKHGQPQFRPINRCAHHHRRVQSQSLGDHVGDRRCRCGSEGGDRRTLRQHVVDLWQHQEIRSETRPP